MSLSLQTLCHHHRIVITIHRVHLHRNDRTFTTHFSLRAFPGTPSDPHKSCPNNNNNNIHYNKERHSQAFLGCTFHPPLINSPLWPITLRKALFDSYSSFTEQMLLNQLLKSKFSLYSIVHHSSNEP